MSGHDELLAVDDLHVRFKNRAHGPLGRSGRWVRAVDGVTLAVGRAERLGLVGESGSGKTTLARAMLRLVPAYGGAIRFDNVDISEASRADMRTLRKRMQMVFQDASAALHPWYRIGDSLTEPLAIHGIGTRAERHDRAVAILATVGLQGSDMTRYPHEFSGGQRQRIAIARSLILEPELLVADEPVSALDMSIQAQIMNLLAHLGRTFDLSLVLVSHDLAVVRHLTQRIAVMYLGRIVEEAPTATLFREPAHPYTVALMSAMPALGQTRRSSRIVLKGDVPSAINPPSGCRFHTRCWLKDKLGNPARCASEDPALQAVGDNHRSACHFSGEIAANVERKEV